MRGFLAGLIAFLLLAAPANAAPVALKTDAPITAEQAVPAATTIDPSKLLVRPKTKPPEFLQDPLGWINYQQRAFSGQMQKTLREIRAGDPWVAAWTLILLSFVYGIFHAAGPGHGKAVVSAWLLANEQQVKRGVIIAFMAAFVQAVTAIAIVTFVLFAVQAAGSVARSFAGYLEAASYGLIALLGLYLLWQGLKAFRSSWEPKPASLSAAVSHHDHVHHHHSHDHHHHHHDTECGCGHAHMPDAKAVSGDWSWTKAFSLAVAVGIRPCSGAILALLASSALGIYWAGIVSTFAMAIGVAITVSVIAVMAVTMRNVTLKMAGHNGIWLDRTAIGLKLAGGLFIMSIGGVLFWNALNNPSSFV